MPRYEIKGKGKETGRRRKRTYFAPNETEARSLAEQDGTEVEEVFELPPDPPTDGQLDYARDLGIAIPPNATKEDVSCLISVKVDNDKPSTARHREFGRKYGIETSECIGKKSLFDLIHSALLEPGRENELVSWFAFRIYRHLVKGAENVPLDSPDDPTFKQIGAQLSSDEKIVKSIGRYKGRDLIWFGEWTAPDGRQYSGGSKRTAAYTSVAALVQQKAGLPEKPARNTGPGQSSRYEKRGTKDDQKGCLSILVLALVIVFTLAVSVLLLGNIFV